MKGLLAVLFGAVLGLLPGILIGALVVTGVGYYESGGTQIPFNLEHNKIAAEINVRVDGKNCEMKHLLSTLAPFYPQTVIIDGEPSNSNPQGIKNIAKFAKSTGNLPMSVWGFSQGGNIQVVMTVMGPPNSNDTNVYLLEFGRLTFLSVSITGLDVNVAWANGSWDGYMLQDVVYP